MAEDTKEDHVMTLEERQGVIAHELGHEFGLQHNDNSADPSRTLMRSSAYNSINNYIPQPYDVAAVNAGTVILIGGMFMSILKSKKIIIPSVSLVIIAVITIMVFSKPVEVFTSVSYNSSNTMSGSNTSISQVVSSASYMYYDNYDELDSRAVFIGEVVKINDPEEIQIGSITTEFLLFPNSELIK